LSQHLTAAAVEKADELPGNTLHPAAAAAAAELAGDAD
jgi:hypothetical protein